MSHNTLKLCIVIKLSFVFLKQYLVFMYRHKNDNKANQNLNRTLMLMSVPYISLMDSEITFALAWCRDI